MGRGTAFTFLAQVPGLGTISHKQVAALVGVAPFDRDSGTLRDKRTVWGGRAGARSALYVHLSGRHVLDAARAALTMLMSI